MIQSKTGGGFMETKKIGILLILIGLVLFVLQIPNLGWQYGLPILSLASLIGYAFVRRTDFLLLAGLVCASLSAWLWFDLDGGLALALGGLSFILTWLIHTRQRPDHWPLIPGFIMILIGGSGFINATWNMEIDGRWIVLLLGLIFAVLYTRRRDLGMLIPACILLAVGTFIIWLVDISPFMIFFALGTAFIAIFLIHTLWHRESGWFWPLIPGGILLTLGTVLTIGESLEGEQFVAAILGLPALILLGIYIWQRNLGLLIPGLMLASVSAWFAIGPNPCSQVPFS
jgi:hypothetical protein